MLCKYPRGAWAAILLLSAVLSPAATFVLPTPNDAIYKGGGEAYYIGTVGRTWESGTYGCVRTDGRQWHEGLDIRAVKRDSQGEPTDPIYAAAAGKVAYLSSNAGLSTYGKYIILEHQIEGIPIYTIYAHLSRFASGLKTGAAVRQGQEIGTMGRTANTRQTISKERAHLHFEICLRLNDRFASWHSARFKGSRNDHGNWNGRNFLGLDPAEILLKQRELGSKFSLLDYLRDRPVMARVLVRDPGFRWPRQYAPLVLRNPKADQHGVAAYEVSIDYAGLPVRLVPRSAAEIQGRSTAKYQVLSVNEAERKACRSLVVKRSGNWQLTSIGQELFDLLTY